MGLGAEEVEARKGQSSLWELGFAFGCFECLLLLVDYYYCTTTVLLLYYSSVLKTTKDY